MWILLQCKESIERLECSVAERCNKNDGEPSEAEGFREDHCMEARGDDALTEEQQRVGPAKLLDESSR